MEATLEVVKREGRGKNEANRLRASGQIPAVVYGSGAESNVPDSVAVTVNPKDVLRILHSQSGVNTLITLKLGGVESRVMVKEFQLDPVTSQLLHADFYKLAMDKVMTVSVPVLLRGESRGVKLQGGMVDFMARDILVECLPTNIPEHIEIDVTELMLNDAVRVRDLPASPTWTALTDGDTMIVHIVLPKAEESATAAAEATPAEGAAVAAEPEVAKKGKPEDTKKGKPEGKEK
jgi:large subunit ribosomal protein L25